MLSKVLGILGLVCLLLSFILSVASAIDTKTLDKPKPKPTTTGDTQKSGTNSDLSKDLSKDLSENMSDLVDHANHYINAVKLHNLSMNLAIVGAALCVAYKFQN